MTLLILSLLSGCNNQERESPEVGLDSLRANFRNPPSSVQTAAYWYWISNNVSKEGVVKDLQAMKDVGINRAFIGSIGLDDVPYGNVEMLSDEWWEALHLALKTAGELDIEIGVFNSPGWSQSGGPWINSENAMRYLASSKKVLNGPAIFSGKLETPNAEFQDVKVLAYPKPKTSSLVLNGTQVSLNSNPAIQNLDYLLDADTSTRVFFPPSKEVILDIEARQPFIARSIRLNYPASPFHANVELQILSQQGSYKTYHAFEIDRTKFSLDVGFDVLAPLQVSFEAVQAKKFRLKFTYLSHEDWYVPGLNENAGLTDISLSSEVLLGNYAEKSLAKMHPTPLPKSRDYQWKEQVEPEDLSFIVQPSQVIDLSSKMDDDGILKWEVPDGEWVVLRTGMTPTGVVNSPASPEATGYEVDKMSKEHVEKHFEGHIGEILRRIPAEDRTAFKVVVQDSYEKGGQNMTDSFLQDFMATYHYDPVPFLPTFNGVVVESQLSSDRFLWDVRRLVADKIAYNYVGGLREISNANDLTTWLENYGHWGFPAEFLQYGGQSDEISGEFWSEGSLGDIENRAAISCGHIYNKSKIWAESFTCANEPFSRSPSDLKPRADRFFAEGINSTLMHLYIHQPYEDKNPGINAWFGNPFNRKNTWFSQMDIFVDYLKRTNYMLQQGLNVADVAYFIGEDTPIMTGETNPPLPVGYEFDYVNAEVILRDMIMKDGYFTLPHGTQYRVLVLPELETMRPSLLKKISELVNEGGVVLGSPPKRSPSGQNQPKADREVANLASKLWGTVDRKQVKVRSLGKGLVMDELTLDEVFSQIDLIPDCRLPEDNAIHYGHRKLSDKDIYFLSNQTDEAQLINPEFRVTGKRPQIWQATSGEIRELKAYEPLNRSTTVPMKLAPYESVFVVFEPSNGRPEGEELALNYPIPTKELDMSKGWIVEFDSARWGPKESVVFDDLRDWTTHENEDIKYYSGMATYRKSFDLASFEKSDHIRLNLGDVTSMAKVVLNGHDVGGVWTAPYSLNITDFLHKGKNELEIEVVNNWMNRIIGDQVLSVDKRRTSTTFNPYTADSSLQSSGLFGPVTLSFNEE